MLQRIRPLSYLLIAALLVAGSAPLLAQPPRQTAEADAGPVVVRVSYRDAADLQRLVNTHDVWQVLPDEGVVLIQLDDPAEADALRAQGRNVVLDPDRTGELRALPETFRGGYRTVEELEAHLGTLAATFPGLTELIDYGDSWEKTIPGGAPGYDLWALRITNEAIAGTKPVFFVIADIHAREIATPEIAWRYAQQLVDGYGVSADITWLLDHTAIYVVYTANPDGHKMVEPPFNYSWRKNTNNTNGSCSPTLYGIDLNRNSDFQWGGSGSSGDPCAATYRGPSAASEPEVTSLQQLLVEVLPDQRPDDLVTAAPLTTTGLFITLHSYAEEIIPPWGFNFSASPNHDQMVRLGMKWRTLSNYVVCVPGDPTSCSVSYWTSGVTEDFVYGRMGVPGYTFEVGTTFYPLYSTITETIILPNLRMLDYGGRVAGGPYWLPAGPDTANVIALPDPVPAGGPAVITATVSDVQNGSQPISAAEYFVVAPGDPAFVPPAPGSATPLAAADGAFDEPIEDVTGVYVTDPQMDGDYLVVVRGRDSLNNWGPLTAGWLHVVNGLITPTPSPTPSPTASATPPPTASATPTATETPGITPTVTPAPGGEPYTVYLPVQLDGL